MMSPTCYCERNLTGSFAGFIGGLTGVNTTVRARGVSDTQHGHVVFEADIIFVRGADLTVVLVPGDGQRLRAGHSALDLYSLTH